MTNQDRLPAQDQELTCIAVHAGNVHLMPAHATAVSPEGVLLTLDTAPDETPTLPAGAPVTLIYAGGDAVLRLKGRVAGSPADGQLEIEAAGAPTQGERRDFIRTEAELEIFVDPLRSTVLEDAIREQEAHPVSRGDSVWHKLLVDISGNGAAFTWDRPTTKGALLDVRLTIPSRRGDGTIAAVGSVVRVKQEGDRFNIAVHFEHIEQEQQDRLFGFVASRYYAEIYRKIADATPKG